MEAVTVTCVASDVYATVSVPAEASNVLSLSGRFTAQVTPETLAVNVTCFPLTTVALLIVIAPAAERVSGNVPIVTVPTFAVTVSELAVSPSATVNTPVEAPIVVLAFAAPVMDHVTPATAASSL